MKRSTYLSTSCLVSTAAAGVIYLAEPIAADMRHDQGCYSAQACGYTLVPSPNLFDEAPANPELPVFTSETPAASGVGAGGVTLEQVVAYARSLFGPIPRRSR